MRLGEFTNQMVIDSEVNEEFEGICGSNVGILWEDSLEQFFKKHGIKVIDYKDNEYIKLKQGDKVMFFNLFEGKEGSSFPAQHIDFECRPRGGYSWPGMKKVTRRHAIKLYNAGQPVYLLYEDNTESLVTSELEIEVFDGEFGVERK